MTAGRITFTPTEHPRDRIAARVRARVFTGGRKRNQNEKERRELKKGWDHPRLRQASSDEEG